VRKSLREKAQAILGVGIDWTIQVSEGHAIEAIRKRVSEQNPDLIVLGSHGRSGMARLLLGSVTENVLHDIHCPALVVPHREKGPGQSVRKIICPVDFTDLSRDCLRVASVVAERFGAHLQVFHSLESKKTPESKTLERLTSWVKDNLECQCEVSSLVSQGNAAEQIVRTARYESADLIVLAVRHRPFLEYSTIGTTTERVLRHSPCPVLAVQ
jgi:nucleotide-binding universal stress UspA family protein